MLDEAGMSAGFPEWMLDEAECMLDGAECMRDEAKCMLDEAECMLDEAGMSTAVPLHDDDEGGTVGWECCTYTRNGTTSSTVVDPLRRRSSAC